MSQTIHERNRANAQHSTGPQTEAGKARSSQNARRHGLSSFALFIPETRQEEFQSLSLALRSEVRPIGELQNQFFDQLLHAAWNAAIAREILAHALLEMDDRRISNANRYVSLHERRFAQAMKELKALQTDMALRVIGENEPIALLPLTCEISRITNEATKLARLPRPAGDSTERTHPHVLRWSTLCKIGAAFAPPAPAEEANPQAA